jgi:hypothetical protein
MYLKGLHGYRKNSFPALTREDASRIEARWGFAFAALGYETRSRRDQREDARSA